MQRIIEGRDGETLILTDLAKEYNVSDKYDSLAIVEIENSRGKLVARMICEKQQLKDAISQLK